MPSVSSANTESSELAAKDLRSRASGTIPTVSTPPDTQGVCHAIDHAESFRHETIDPSDDIDISAAKTESREIARAGRIAPWIRNSTDPEPGATNACASDGGNARSSDNANFARQALRPPEDDPFADSRRVDDVNPARMLLSPAKRLKKHLKSALGI
jgi:hypothetical protein